jgi:hypothetical protein
MRTDNGQRVYGDGQFLVSVAIDPRLETKPGPNVLPRPEVERMKVLDASRGRVATFRQNAAHLPFCKYCSTFER